MGRGDKKASSCSKGSGLLGDIASTVVNKAIDILPFEAHIPGYQYCGPGTKLAQRLARGDRGINPLDEACKIHDIAYDKYSDSGNRTRADKELAERAWRRFTAADSSLGEKAAAWAVTTAMKAKTALGSGSKQRKNRKRDPKPKGKGLYLRPYPKKDGAGVKKKKRVVKKKNLVTTKTID